MSGRNGWDWRIGCGEVKAGLECQAKLRQGGRAPKRGERVNAVVKARQEVDWVPHSPG